MFRLLTYWLIALLIAPINAAADSISYPNDINLHVGKSSLIHLDEPIARISLSDPKIADINVINSKEIYVLAKMIGGTNLIIWNKSGRSTIREIHVDVDMEPLRRNIAQLLPDQKDVQLSAVSGSVVISGSVENIIQADVIKDLAEAFIMQVNRISQGSGSQSNGAQNVNMPAASTLANASSAANTANRYKVINLLKIRDPQQVMLQVKVAEVNKDYLEKIGVKLNGNIGQFKVLSNFSLKGLSVGSIGAITNKSGTNILDAEKNEELVRVLAEPTIVAMSGQEGSFLVGGKIYLPQYSSQGSPSTTQVEYGVGLKFLPIVLDKGRINLKVAPEVSNISEQSFSYAGPNNTTTFTIVPKVITKSVSTTVQIREGETLVIGGLLNNEVTEIVKAFPVLGDIPVIGALFRSKQFISKKTELIVIVTPSLVAAVEGNPVLPNDRYKTPSKTEFFLGGDISNQFPDEKSKETINSSVEKK